MKTKNRRIFLTLALLVALCIPALALADSQSATITGNSVNLRTGPDLSYARIRYLYKGDQVSVTGKSGSWYAVVHNGSSGYVSASYVALEESASAASTPAATGSGSTLKKGASGSAVKTLQGNLIMLGYLNSRADGQFGAKTETAVRQYQRRNGLAVDGIAGAKTNACVQAEVLRTLAVVDCAKSFLGTPYVYGGSSPKTGFDCSGLVQYAHAQAGLTTPRVSSGQAAAGISVPRGQLRYGDVVCFNSPVSHVGIYVGNGQFIHSPHTGDVVKITNLSAMNLTAIRRYTGVLAG
jgi:cell wall-associated NlpC family hydrolase